MFSVTINGRVYEVKEGLSIIEACDSLDIKIPRFCYLKGLSIPANCRMCLVEIKGARKLVPACHTAISNGIEIFTESKNVILARKKIMSYLLINHPLDCPICDEAGECELQNQAVAFGFNDSYYEFSKRARVNLYLGPLISTSMNKCINCTRCIRFMNEVAGLTDLGVLNRGEEANISNYLSKPIDSELSGNLVDVCPVGALNNAQYLYRDRPWELTNIQTIDIIDSLCSKIIVNLVNEEVVRILPINYPIMNKSWSFFYQDWDKVKDEETITYSSPLWISDKTRYICDALDIQRLDTPWIKEGNKLRPATFKEAFALIKSNIVNLTGKEIAALAGKFADVESMLLLKELMASLGSNLIECRLNHIAFNSKDRNSYIFNTTLEGINEADCILMVGTNPKKEVPVLNSVIRKRFLETGLPIGVIGEDIELNYPTINLGKSILSLLEILNNKNNFANILQQATKPMLILGEDAFTGQDFNEVLSLVYAVCNKFKIVTESWNGYNFINTSVANIGGIDIGFTNNEFSFKDILNRAITREIKFIWLLNVDDIDFNKLNNSFVVYMGHHGDKGAESANVILPSVLWLEKNATFVNIEGKVLQTTIVKKAPKEAKEDWKILKAFSDFLGYPLPYRTLSDIRIKMEQVNEVFSSKNANTIINNSKDFVFNSTKNSNFILKDVVISSVIKDYYLTDVISRNSSTLAKCSQLFNKNNIEEVKVIEEVKSKTESL